jgi:hypothetical protein
MVYPPVCRDLKASQERVVSRVSMVLVGAAKALDATNKTELKMDFML